MVLFDFICGDCGAIYERLMKSDTIPECKVCGSTENQAKVVSGPKLAYAKNDDSPKTHRDLRNYLGNGQYYKGYKR